MRRALAPLSLVALTLVVWAGVLRVPFQYDDFPTLVLDPATAILGRLRPLLRLSFALDHALWGLDPRGFHATNLALHVATVVGVWALARRRLAGELPPLVAAAAFAVQPAHAEVVAYVSGRSTGLMAALLVWALVAYAGGRRATAAALAVAACLAKEVAVIFPALLVAWELGRGRRAATRPAAIALALAGAALAGTALVPRARQLLAFSLALRDPVESLAVNLAAVPEMISLWVRPWALSVDHGLGGGSALPGALLLGAAAVVAFVARRRAPLVTLAIVWTVVALIPTNSVIAKLDPVTEKPLYLAWVGPSLLLGAIAAWRPARPFLAAALVAGAVWCGARVAVWQDARTLWADAAAKAPGNARAWNNLGMAHAAAGERARARGAFRTALRLDPGDVTARQNLVRLDDPWG